MMRIGRMTADAVVGCKGLMNDVQEIVSMQSYSRRPPKTGPLRSALEIGFLHPSRCIRGGGVVEMKTDWQGYHQKWVEMGKRRGNLDLVASALTTSM